VVNEGDRSHGQVRGCHAETPPTAHEYKDVNHDMIQSSYGEKSMKGREVEDKYTIRGQYSDKGDTLKIGAEYRFPDFV